MGAAVGELTSRYGSPREAGPPVPPRPRVTPHALKVTRYDPELAAMVRHVYGYSWTCSEHGRGPRFETMREARTASREHEAGHRA